MVRAMLTATAFLIGVAAMPDADGQDVKPDPFTDTVTVTLFRKDGSVYETRDVKAFKLEKPPARWALKLLDYKGQVTPKKGSVIVDKDKKAWVVTEASEVGTDKYTARILCRVVPKD